MIRLHNTTTEIKRALILCLFGAMFLIGPAAIHAGTESGLSIDLYTPSGADQAYLLGDPEDKISMVMVIKNVSPWKIATRRLFSQGAIHNSIIVTGPDGQKYFPEKEAVDDEMPPPVFWSDGKKTRELLPAELLDKGWVKSVEIDDLRTLVPVMNELPGSYTIECRQPFTRFAWTMEMAPQGLMGVVDDRNWTGAVPSNNTIKIFIKPAAGARFKVRVEDVGAGNAIPVSMQPVRVFKGSGLNLDNQWKRGKPVMTGTTDLNGWAVWHSGDVCLPSNTYTIVASYKNAYEQVVLTEDDAGWEPECGGRIVKKVYFGKRDEKYVIYADNSVSVGNNVVIHSGNVGAPEFSEGPWLSGKVEVDIANNVVLEGDAKLIGDSVALSASAVVNDVYYNDLADAGAVIGGLLCSPIAAPEADGCKPEGTWERPIIDIETGSFVKKTEVEVVVGSDTELTLPSGPDYGEVILESNAILRLSGGVYGFNNLYMGSNASLVCDDATEIRIGERLYPGSKSFIGISSSGENKGYRAKDVVIYVAGQNGKKGFLNSVPEAAVIGEGSVVKANIYAPGGTLRTREGCDLTGSFIALDVAIGQKTKVALDSYFQP